MFQYHDHVVCLLASFLHISHHQDDNKLHLRELYHLTISHHIHLHQHELNVLCRLLYCLSTSLHT
jgi:hypothetical protein